MLNHVFLCEVQHLGLKGEGGVRWKVGGEDQFLRRKSVGEAQCWGRALPLSLTRTDVIMHLVIYSSIQCVELDDLGLQTLAMEVGKLSSFNYHPKHCKWCIMYKNLVIYLALLPTVRSGIG